MATSSAAVSDSQNIDPETRLKVLEIVQKFLSFEEIVSPEEQASKQEELVQETINSARKIRATDEQESVGELRDKPVGDRGSGSSS